MLAVIGALKKWRIYVLGKTFKLVTDCQALTKTIENPNRPERVKRWIIFLQDFRFKPEYRPCNKMRHVDALSRVNCLFLDDALNQRLKQAQLQDDWIKAVRKVLETKSYEDYYVQHDGLYKDPTKEIIVVPSLMEEEIIRLAHKQNHFSIKKTKDAVEKMFYIPNLQQKVTKIVKSCIECIINEQKAGKQEGYLQSIYKEDKPLDTYHIDHVGPMEQTKKLYNYLLVVTDGFSKFTWLYPTKDTGAEAVVDRLTKQATVFGNPRRIVTDRGAAFTSNLFKEYCKNENIQHLLITTGVPRGNGQVERVHKIVVPMLAKLSTNEKNWYKYVDRVQQAINNSPPRSTKVAPFKILTGLEMRTNDMPNINEILQDNSIVDLDTEREKIRHEARQNIDQIQAENRRTYNSRRKAAAKYTIGELVAIKRTQYGNALRLRPKYFGPYKVTNSRNHDRYDVIKLGQHEGPNVTNTVAENMKKWQ